MRRHLCLAALGMLGLTLIVSPARGGYEEQVAEIGALARRIEERAAQGGPATVHAAVEFSGTLSPREFERLRMAGADVRGSASSRKWVATLSAEGLRTIAGYRGLSLIRTMRPSDKASPRLDRARPAPWQMRPGGQIAYKVMVFDDVTATEVERLRAALAPARLEGFDPAMFDRLRTFEIVIDPSKLDALLEAEIIAYVDRPPPPPRRNNLESARLARVGELVDPNDPDNRLSGAGVTVAVIEAGAAAQIRSTHSDLAGRVSVVDAGTETTHATHVAGTIVSRGRTFRGTRGIAPRAGIYGFNSANDAKDAILAANYPHPAIASNHSYGSGLGWELESGSWTDQGSAAFGAYAPDSAKWDRMVAGDLNQSPVNLVIVKSAGNDRDDVDASIAGAVRDCTSTYAPSDGDCLDEFAIAKNVITVGAVQSTAPATVAIADFSSFGPTDDGRIKPDLVAHGVNVISTGFTTSPTGMNVDAELADSGTSMAAPVVTGIVSLMAEAFARRGRTNVWPATYKALLVEHARDVTVAPATRGPDFATGFGIADAAATIRAILEPAEPHYREWWIRDVGAEGRVVYFIRVDTNMPELAVTLAWSDPAPEAAFFAAPLVNDLDLRLIEPGSGREWAPLRPAVNGSTLVAATRGDDDRNNVEKVIVPNPRQGLWTVRVTAKPNSLSQGAQPFALAGPFAAAEPPSTCTVTPGVCALPAILRRLRGKSR